MLNPKNNFYLISIFICLLLFTFTTAFSQELTRIRGQVLDAETDEPLPFVNIYFVGTTEGTVSDLEGQFYLESQAATAQLNISYIGYNQVVKAITLGNSQRLTIKLSPSSTQLADVVIKGKLLRYKNKGNPAIGLIKRILEHKKENQPKQFDYYEYDKYEKIEFDFNNISEKFMNKRMMRDFQLIFNYMDTSEINGKSYLPIFLREVSSKVYYRKSPEKTVEYKQGEKMTGFNDYFNDAGLSSLIDKMYQKIDIYSSDISVLTQKFVSPISALSPLTYKYYIADTLIVKGEKLFKLSFRPRNETDLAFVGNLFITTDSAYAVKKASFSITKNANINFVEDLIIEQEFEKTANGSYVLQQDKINIDFSILSDKGVGVYGKRTVSFKDRKFNIQQPDKLFEGMTLKHENPNAHTQTEEFWGQARHMELSRSEQGVVAMTNEVKELPAFQRMVHILTLVIEGYEDIGLFEIGPINTFMSFNDVEGFRMRFGGRTSEAFSDKWRIEGYVARGFKDKETKYTVGLTRFFRRKPFNAVAIIYQKEIYNPGENLGNLQRDNFLLSFKRGKNFKRIYNYQLGIEHSREVGHGFSYTLGVKKEDIQPGGILRFQTSPYFGSDFISKSARVQQTIETFETNVTLKFAPNEQYYDGSKRKISIINEHPVFTINYTKGFENVFGSDYSYDKLSAKIFKRTYLTPLGYIDIELEGSKLYGKVPYPLLNIPRANQTFNYQIRGYNLMQYLEFVSDQYASVNYTHYFNGFFMNKIPLIKKLKWRSMITFKGIVGNLSDTNNPTLDQSLAKFPNNTTALSHYIETSVGIGNIFSFLRIDVVQRWTQLGHPGVALGYAIRGRVKIQF